MKLTSEEDLFLALKLFINIAAVNLFYSLYIVLLLWCLSPAGNHHTACCEMSNPCCILDSKIILFHPRCKIKGGGKTVNDLEKYFATSLVISYHISFMSSD